MLGTLAHAAKRRSLAVKNPVHPRHLTLVQSLGPGIITGAADDDPSGIATYAQAGAQFRLNMLWTVVLTFPLMVAIQSVAARIGRVTGKGLAANIKGVFPAWVLIVLVLGVVVANVINIGADLSAMAEATRLILPEPVAHFYVIAFALLSLGLEVLLPYKSYVRILKWLTLALLAYVAVAFAVKVPWTQVAIRTVLPQLSIDKDSITMVVAIFGTTISPYLFFWQSSQEVEEIEAHDDEEPLQKHPDEAPEQLHRIRLDTVMGMLFSNAVAFFIILSTAVTLGVHGMTEIKSAAQAATALRPIAGDFAFSLFALGIIGTGLLALPVLAGSAAYAVAEALGWKSGLARKFKEAVGFYSVMTLATIVGVGLDFTAIDPFEALVGAAVVNGVVAPLIMVAAMLVAQKKSVMGEFTVGRLQGFFGWAATAVMGVAAIALIVVSV
ncbi:MAG: divalent metal cation transporter [Proteobacteria bacterium]|nr:divalent metal cation transporter [Pseudomonadota bacterium]